jgi:anion transporter
VGAIVGPPPAPVQRVRAGTVAMVALAAASLVFVWFVPLPMPVEARHALAIACLMVILWAGEVLPHAITGLLGCWLFWALEVVPARTAFSGFANEAPWFLLGALLMGALVVESGLGRRLALTILARVGSSFPRILLAFILTDFALTFVVPAGPPRVILLGSIVLEFLASYGLDRRSNMARALVLGISFSATLFDKSVLASTPSILARSLIGEFGHVTVSWSQWFIAFAPLDFLNIALVWWVIVRLYPPELPELPGGKAFLREQLGRLGPWQPDEKRAAALIAVAVGLWATDFLHHIDPAVIGLGAGLAATLPRVGVLTAERARSVNFFVVIFMGATISMAETLRDTKALETISQAVFHAIGPYVHDVWRSTLALYWSAVTVHLLLASETSMIAVSMPLVMQFAQANHLNPLALGLVWSFATGAKLFIYQSLVLIAAHSLGAFDARDVLKLGAFFLIVESILLLLLVPYYWPLIGIG